jgi:hypothetical protein
MKKQTTNQATDFFFYFTNLTYIRQFTLFVDLYTIYSNPDLKMK